MVLFWCKIEAGWLKAFLRAYNAMEKWRFYWLWTREHVEGKVLDSSGLRARAIVFRIFPLEYGAEWSAKYGGVLEKAWVEGDVDVFVKAVKRYKVREIVPLEVRDDGSFWVGGVQVGHGVEEKDVPEGFIIPTPAVKPDGFLKVVVSDFKRIVGSLPGVKFEDAAVGFKFKGRDESTMILFKNEETFSRVDIKPYEKWLLDVGGVALSCYSLDLFNASLVLGLSEVVTINVGDQAPCEISYSGDFFDLKFYIANSDYRFETFKLLLEKKPAYRHPIFVLGKEQVEVLRGVIRAVDPLYRGAEVWFGVNPYDFWFYWSFYDKGYFKMSRSAFEAFMASASYAGSFDLPQLSSWIRDVETLECWLEDETPKAMLLVGKGEKIAGKELRSSEFKTALDVPDVKKLDVFTGPKDILSSVFEDAVTAKDDFLVFIATPYEIKVIGKDVIYYRASLPLDGFKLVVEDYVPVSDRFLKPLKDFFSLFTGHVVSVGRPETGFDIYVGGDTAVGEFRALLAQTTDEASRAIDAYKEEIKPPAPPKPEEVKPIPALPKSEDVSEVLYAAEYHIMKHEDLVNALVEKNFDKSATLDLIADMIKKGELYEPRPPYIRLTGLATEVRFVKDIPGIVGVDFRIYGPYKAGEIAWLPKENAEILIKQGAAESPVPQPPKLSLEEFAKMYNDKLDEWIRFGVDLHRSGLAGNLHYEVPEREKETVAKFTLETVRAMYRVEIEKDIPVAYSSYETFYGRGAGDKFLERWFPDRLHHFAGDLAKKTSDALFEEAKKPAPVPDIVKTVDEAIKELEAL